MYATLSALLMGSRVKLRIETATRNEQEYGRLLRTTVVDGDNDLTVLCIESVSMYCDEDDHMGMVQAVVAKYKARQRERSAQ